jgi:hypothetical protein
VTDGRLYDLPPSPRVQYLIEEIEGDPDALFWGQPAGQSALSSQRQQAEFERHVRRAEPFGELVLPH